MRGDERLTTRARDAEQTATAMSAVRYQMSPTPNEKRRLSSMTSAREGFQGVASTERNAKRRRATGGEWEIGTLGKLPTEVLELVLLNLDVKDLARVASTCTYFNASGIVERVAGARMEFVPRAAALMLTKRDSYLKAWHHCTFSERAERAAGNVSLGQFHTACVTGNESDTTGMVVSTFGRGFHGQIGDGSFETRAVPTRLNLNDEALDIGRVARLFLGLEGRIQRRRLHLSRRLAQRGAVQRWHNRHVGARELGRARACWNDSDRGKRAAFCHSA